MPKRKISEIKPYKLKSGKTRYKFQTYLGLDSFGKRIMVTRQGFKSYSEAEAKYTELRAKGSQGYVKPKQSTLDDVWSLWFDNHCNQVKESTANKTKQVYTNHIEPYFGKCYVDKIQTASVQKWINQKSKEIVKYRNAYNILNNLLKYSRVLGYLQINPLDHVMVPKIIHKKKRDDNYYDNREELEKCLEAAKKQNIRKYTFFKLLASTGLRKGEALALEWSDIDFDSSTIHITKTLAQGLDNKQIIQPPKTPHSYRDVPMSNNLSKALKDYRRSEKILYPIVFCKQDGTHLNLSAPSNWLHYLYKKNKDLKRITVHGFRHTFATLMLQPGMGNTPKDVQMILGHENIKMTLDIYTHESEKGKLNAAKAVNTLNI